MNTLKRLGLTLMSCVMLAGCGRTANSDESMPDGIVEVAPTTQSEEFQDEYNDYEEAEPDTTRIIYEPELYTQTTTAVRRGRVYVASAAPAPPAIRTVTTAAEQTTAPLQTRIIIRSTTAAADEDTASGTSVHTAPITTAASTSAHTSTVTTARRTVPPTVTTTAVTTTYAGISPEKQLSKLTLRQKVSQLFIASPDQLTGVKNATDANTTMKRTIADTPVGGVIFNGSNLTSKKQLSAMLINMTIYFEQSCGIGTMVSVSEQGGKNASPVSEKLLTTGFYEPSVYGKENDPEHVYDIGKTMGNELLKLGFRLNLAPNADLSGGYSSDEHIAAELVKSMVSGLKDSGVYSAVGNFPGTDKRSGRTLKQLRAVEFVPFKAAVDEGVSFICMGHQRVSGFGDGLPADLSQKAVGCIRSDLDFGGVIVSGAMNNEAITGKYASGEAAVASIKAGVDMILLPEDLAEAVDALCKAVESGDISEERLDESVLRVLTVKKAMGLY
ncbi:MAG: hypothetical protein GXY08_13770 [Ruminococcus sp.]|nr:hypothetical protein [Ruminococcus sp.]